MSGWTLSLMSKLRLDLIIDLMMDLMFWYWVTLKLCFPIAAGTSYVTCSCGTILEGKSGVNYGNESDIATKAGDWT